MSRAPSSAWPQFTSCGVPWRDATPGGGGINVARVLKRLGADVVAVYPTGGVLGTLLRQLVADEGIPCLTIGIADETREDITVLDRSIDQQYRFILPGPQARANRNAP
jgi:6-phosphofructokinase 2